MLKVITSLSLLFSLVAFAQDHHPTPGGISTTHGMLLFGTKEKIYLSHWPMFHAPHDYQVLFQVTLNPKVKEIYIKDAEATKDVDKIVYSFEPKPFVLEDFINNPTPLIGSISRGHYEQQDEEEPHLPKDIQVNVKVLYSKKLNSNTEPPKNAQYLVFGDKFETFMAHVITSKPSFDHIFQVKIEDKTIMDALKTKPFLKLELPGFSENQDLDEKLQNNQELSVRLEGSAEIKKLTLLKKLYSNLDFTPRDLK